MSEVYIDNQEVTTDELNNTAVDLGLPEFNGFGESKFGVDLLNKITADLSGAGVLNVKDKCTPVLNGNILSISTGVIVFESGAKIRLEEPASITLDDSAEKTYIYAVNDTVRNIAVLRAEKEELTSGDFVLLCEAENGILQDKRLFAKSKLSAGGSTQVQTEKMSGSGLEYLNTVLVQSIPLLNPSPSRVIGYILGRRYCYNGHCPLFVYDVERDIHITVNRSGDNHIDISEKEYGEGSLLPVTVDDDNKVGLKVEGGMLNVYAYTTYKYQTGIGGYTLEIL